MKHHEIITQFAVDPSEIIYAITVATVLSAIVNRLGEDALSLTVEQIGLAREEVKAAIDHNLDIRDYWPRSPRCWRLS